MVTSRFIGSSICKRRLGSAAGLSDIADVGTPSSASSLTFTNVMPGVSFIRIRLLYAPSSLPSNEVTAIVDASCVRAGLRVATLQ